MAHCKQLMAMSTLPTVFGLLVFFIYLPLTHFVLSFSIGACFALVYDETQLLVVAFITRRNFVFGYGFFTSEECNGRTVLLVLFLV